jgi:hypothetical protein
MLNACSTKWSRAGSRRHRSTENQVGRLQRYLLALTVVLLWSGTSVVCAAAGPPTDTISPNARLAAQHLASVIDKYQAAFDVYTDVGAGGNHFVHRARTGSSVTIDDSYTGTVHSGATAIRNTFSPATSVDWGGWFFQNGVLLPGATQPSDNWGTYPDAGYDLRGATSLTFWARGAQGGERVEFFAFGSAAGPYGDSAPTTTLGGSSSLYYITLQDTWQLYTMTLTGLDLQYIITGFGWVTNAPQNNSQPIVFYLDDIRYNLPRPNAPRPPVSYETLPLNTGFDLQFRNVAFTYDSAVALSALLAYGDQVHAKFLADALVYAYRHDRFDPVGRIRNAYQSGDLAIPPGWQPAGAARLPGYWQPVTQQWVESPEQVGATSGNLAWVMIGLLNYYEVYGGSGYLDVAREIGKWVAANTSSASGGYTGGYLGPDVAPVVQTWKSTEHNIDLYVAFDRLYNITGETAWEQRAANARSFVDSMWSAGEGHYWTGTLADGATINTEVIPLDIQAWAVLAFGADGTSLLALQYAVDHLKATYQDPSGFDFQGFTFSQHPSTLPQQMPWPEGTAQMVSAFRASGGAAAAQFYLAELRELQIKANNGNGQGIVAAPADGLETGFGSYYYNRLHVGATAWYLCAELGYNPYQAPAHHRLYLPVLVRAR